MKIVARALMLFAVAASCSIGITAARADAAPPYEAVRSLQALQNKLAAGDKAAASSQAAMMAQIAGDFAAAPADVWKDPKNARAAITFVLSGGGASIITTIIGKGTAPADQLDLMRATLAYGQGREADAKKLFAAIDPHALVESLGGQVALVEATLFLQDDRQKGVALLDFARLTMPGSLVEEAALRREVFVFGEAGDVSKFIALSRQYIRRFRQSIYADNFMQGLVAAITRLGPMNDVAQLAPIEDMLAMLGPDDERNLLLLVADAAVAGGKTPTALAAAKKGAELAKDGSVDQARARLYQAAAMVVTDQYDAALTMLKSVELVKFAPEDNMLRSAVTNLAAQLRTPAKVPDAAPAPLPASSFSLIAVPMAKATATLQKAQLTFDEADRLLGASAL